MLLILQVVTNMYVLKLSCYATIKIKKHCIPLCCVTGLDKAGIHTKNYSTKAWDWLSLVIQRPLQWINSTMEFWLNFLHL